MRILLVRLRQIGDVVFTTPVVRALRQKFPDAHLTYVVEPAAAAVVLDNPHLNDVIVAPRARGWRGLRDDLALARRLRAGRYDLAIDFHGGPRASLLTWLSAAPVRIGYDVVARGWMYTRRIARPRELRSRHSVENQWDLLAALDVFDRAPPDRSAFPVEMTADAAAVSTVADRLARAGVEVDDPIVVLHVSAGNPFRRWPIAHFVALVDALVKDDPRRRIIITSGPSEQHAAERVAGGAAGATRPRGALHRRRQRSAAHCGDDERAGGGIVWTDAAGAVGAVARRPPRHRIGGRGRFAVPSVRSARVRARRFPLFDADSPGAGIRSGEARDGTVSEFGIQNSEFRMNYRIPNSEFQLPNSKFLIL
ncbi:MAG: hypothetical protein AUF76_13730 [Acidobacteria bacterium 13_1_20CM_2_65_9]|nr:MAG: hypothetical protein AUF76_13730 [Acidobacteria bacterium 13_1_20CM_2_65_9]